MQLINFIGDKSIWEILTVDNNVIWNMLERVDKNKIKDLIKKIVKIIKNSNNPSKQVTYFMPQYEIKNILQWYYDNHNINLIIIEFSKRYNKSRTNYDYGGYTVYNRDGGNYIDNSTHFGFLTSEVNHMNVLCRGLFKYEEIPVTIKRYVDIIFS
jgi:hypothetical protein